MKRTLSEVRVTLAPAVARRLRAEAAQRGTSVSALVRAAAIRIQTDGDRYTSPEAEALRAEFPELCERVPIPPEVAP